MIDAYVKRFKSASFAALLALLVGLSLATSRSGLIDAHDEARRWQWVSVALEAELDGRSVIERIGPADERAWRKQHPGLPKYGTLLDVVRNLGSTESVSGRIADAANRMVLFEATPLSPDDQNCRSESSLATTYCVRMQLHESKRWAETVHFQYQVPAGGNGQWLARATGTSRAVDRAGVEAHVLRLAEPWVGKHESAMDAVDALYDKLRSQTIKLPVLNLDLPAQLASVALALFALVTAYMAATSLAGLDRVYDPTTQKEPWIVPRTKAAGASWTGSIESSLPLISRAGAFAQVFVPAIVLLVALILSPMLASSYAVAACAVPVVFMIAYSTRTLRLLLRRID